MKGTLGCMLLALSCGCSYQVDTAGDRSLKSWRRHELHPSLAELVAQIGPPQTMRPVGEQLYCYYGFRELVRSDFVLTYYLNIFKLVDETRADFELVLVFDRQDRLVLSAVAAR